VVRLQLRRRLDLDHPVAAAAPFEDVGAHEEVAGAQRGLEQRDVAGLRQELAGLLQRRLQLPDVFDQVTLRKQPLCGGAHAVPLRHAVLDGLAALRELGPPHLQVQALRALPMREQLGLGEFHRVRLL
jgi:hypothetical protein